MNEVKIGVDIDQIKKAISQLSKDEKETHRPGR